MRFNYHGSSRCSLKQHPGNFISVPLTLYGKRDHFAAVEMPLCRILSWDEKKGTCGAALRTTSLMEPSCKHFPQKTSWVSLRSTTHDSLRLFTHLLQRSNNSDDDYKSKGKDKDKDNSIGRQRP